MTEQEERRFKVIVQWDDPFFDGIDVTQAVLDVYDIATGCMDWGSAFLETSEVESIKGLGKALGLPPLEYAGDKCDRCTHDRQSHWSDGCRHSTYLRSTAYHPDDPNAPASQLIRCDCPSFLEVVGFSEAPSS